MILPISSSSVRSVTILEHAGQYQAWSRIAAKLEKAMMFNAPLRLAELKKAHVEKLFHFEHQYTYGLLNFDDDTIASTLHVDQEARLRPSRRQS